METAPDPRCGSRAVAVLVRSRGRSAAWDAPSSGVLRGADEAADLDGPGHERVLQGRKLVLGRLLDLAVVVVEWRQQDAVVGERAAVVLATHVAARARLEEVEDGDVDGLLRRRQQRAVGRRTDADVLVGVDADRPLPSGMHGLDGAVPGAARDRVDDVHAVVEEGLGELLALGRVAPGVIPTATPNEGRRLGGVLLRRIPAHQGHRGRGLLLLVEVLDAGIEAVHEAGRAREGLARVGAD